MENYDLIILGAGIAGSGLAFNLKSLGYGGRVIVLDPSPGSNEGYGHRNTFREVIDEYSLPYVKKFKGVVLGTKDEIFYKVDHDAYFVSYKGVCDSLMERSGYEVRNEKALSLSETLLTDRSEYSFRYLVDCTGSAFFGRRQLHLDMPRKYWVGKLFVLDVTYLEGYDKDYFYFLAEEDGSVQDIYHLEDKVITGHWGYGGPAESPDYDFISVSGAYLPASPVLPLRKGNVFFLGDSFGNATPSTGEGIRPILDTSKMLVRSLMGGKEYEKAWKEKYLDSYIRILAAKSDMKSRMQIVMQLENHPEVIVDFLKNNPLSLPEEVVSSLPKRVILKQMMNYIRLKLQYM